MNFITKGFLIAAVLYGLLGLVYGLMMAISQDHSQMPTHAHIMVVGWVSFALFGLFYHQFADAVSLSLAKLHFWLAQVSMPGLMVGLTILYSGNEVGDPVAAVSAIIYSLSFVIFSLALMGAVKKSN